MTILRSVRIFFILSLFTSLNISCAADPQSVVSRPVRDDKGIFESPDVFTGGARIRLTSKTTLYALGNDGILVERVTLSVGSTIEIPVPYEIQNFRYRKSDGTTDWTSTGFIGPVAIISAASEHAYQFPEAEIDELNQTPAGLYVFASIVSDLHGVEGDFDAIAGGTPGEGFLKSFEANGKPKFNYAEQVKKRFGAKLNKGVDPKKLSSAERVKWTKIYNELKRAANRKVPTPKAILMIDREAAMEHSIAYEKFGVIPFNGAWTIAVLATAVRHGFPNVPCAEFMSELLRQAYQRAGYAVTDDFNKAKKNQLIWSNTAAVVNFSKALYTAGWIPWETSKYRPITGALMMHVAGQTPGHTYISAGDDGRLIVDNGSPQGRDLRVTTEKTINLMYKSGVFFLPPGINPPKW